MRVLRPLALAVLLLLPAPLAHATEVIIGQITGLRGEVFRETGDRREPAARGMPIRTADALAAYAGKAQVLLNDGSILSLGEQSRLEFRAYRGAGNGFTTQLGASTGAFRLIVHRLTQGSQAGGLSLETETAVAAVRGTDWLVLAGPDTTAVACLEGSVEVASRDIASATGAAVLLGPGQGTDVPRGGAPRAANTWGAQRLADAVARASFD